MFCFHLNWYLNCFKQRNLIYNHLKWKELSPFTFFFIPGKTRRPLYDLNFSTGNGIFLIISYIVFCCIFQFFLGELKFSENKITKNEENRKLFFYQKFLFSSRLDSFSVWLGEWLFITVDNWMMFPYHRNGGDTQKLRELHRLLSLFPFTGVDFSEIQFTVHQVS